MLSLAPAVGLYYAAFMADKIEFAESYIEYEFSPVSLKLVKANKFYEDFLKEIKTDFAPQEEGEDPSALQLIVDENLINGVIGTFLKMDTMYSLRELLALDPRLVMMRQLLTTTTIGMAIPQFKEEFGENRPIDLVFTSSHEFMTNGLGTVNPTSVSLDANGNFVASVNLGAQIIVTGTDGTQAEARSLYVQFQLKGKMFVADAKHDNRTLVVLPKSLSMPVFKVMNSNADEQFMEQMLVQSMVQFQLDNLKKQFKPAVIPLKKFENPPEFQCLGFNLTNIHVKINKGFVQANGAYTKLNPDQIDKKFCDSFEEKLAKSPAAMFKKIANSPLFDNPMVSKLFDGGAKDSKKRDNQKKIEEL